MARCDFFGKVSKSRQPSNSEKIMNKVDNERNILKVALPLLKKLYGDFDEDQNQLDKPDAAIILKQKNNDTNLKPAICIGIEITSIDKQGDQQYLNDEKFTKSATLEQIKQFLSNGTHSNQPLKKISIAFDERYIFDGVIKKQEKYTTYISDEKYSEIIVLAFSSHMSIASEDFADYHSIWTNYLLSEQRFPFDKVIFACKMTNSAVLIYDKNHPNLNKPQQNQTKEQGITTIKTSFIPMGREVNMNDWFENDPIVKKVKKPKKQ